MSATSLGPILYFRPLNCCGKLHGGSCRYNLADSSKCFFGVAAKEPKVSYHNGQIVVHRVFWI